MLFNVWTDGSSFINDDKTFYESSSAYLVKFNNMKYEGFDYHPNGTNQLGELYAILMALRKIKSITKDTDTHDICIYTDSDYSKNCITKWIHNWIKNGWKTSSTGEDVKHSKIIKEIFYGFPNLNLNIFHVRGHITHNGVKGKLSIALGFEKFKTKNSVDISMKVFEKIVEGNHRVDTLAEICREYRIGFEHKDALIV